MRFSSRRSSYFLGAVLASLASVATRGVSFAGPSPAPSVAVPAPSPSDSPPTKPSETPATTTTCQPEVWQLGVDRYRQRDVTGAIAIWEKHVEVCGEGTTWKGLYNLGLAYAEVGDITRAARRLDAFLANLPQDVITQSGVAARFEDARKRLETIRVTHVTLRVLKAPDRVVLVRLEQGEPRPAGFEEWLEPGTHSVVVDEGTARAKTMIVNAKAGEVRVIAHLALNAKRQPPPVVVGFDPLSRMLFVEGELQRSEVDWLSPRVCSPWSVSTSWAASRRCPTRPSTGGVDPSTTIPRGVQRRSS